MIRRFSKLLRVAGVVFMVALLSLSGELNILGLEIGSSVPTAKAAQIAIARPKLKFRDSDGQFLVVGENGGVPGILVENALGGGTCYQSIIGTSSSAIKSRIAFDAAGNVYVVWMEAPPNSGYQVFMAVMNSSCTQVPGSPFAVSSLLSATYGVSSAAGYPDIAYSPSENRVYLTFQGPGPNKQVLAFSGIAGTSGWNSGNRWDKVWGLPNAQAEAYPRITVAPADGTGNVRAHIVFKSNNSSNGYLRAVDLSGGANGTWNQYTNSIGLDISNNPNNNVTDGSQEIGNSNDGSTYATYFSPGNGPLSVGMNKFEPTTGSWGTGRDNVVGSSGADYNSLISSGLGVGHTTGVYIGLGVPSYVLTYTSADKGATFPANQHRNFGPYSGNMVAVTIAEGNNTVVVYSLDGVRVNHLNTFTGVETPPLVTAMDAPANGSVISIPAGQPTTNVQLSWHKVSGGVGNLPITYYVDIYSSSAPSWQPLVTTTATTYSVALGPNQTVSFRVRGSEGPSGSTESPHAVADTTITVKYSLFTSLDMGIDALGYYAPSGTSDNNTPPSPELVYFPLPQPIRLLDTRSGPGITGIYTPAAPLSANTVYNYKAAGNNIAVGNISIPPEARALSANTTVLFPTSAGFLTMYPGPTNSTRPTVANMVFNGGVLESNTTTLTIGSDSTINLYSNITVDIGIDITGYYAPANTVDPNTTPPQPGLQYYPLSKPIRLLDTRTSADPNQTLIHPNAPLTGGTAYNYKLAGTGVTVNGISIPGAAKALAGNITVLSPTAIGFLTAYPGPSNATRPIVANVTFGGGVLLANGAIMTLGSDNTLNLYPNVTTDVSIDITGYYAPTGTSDPNTPSRTGLSYYPLPKPTRILDTRTGPGIVGLYTPGAPIKSVTAGVPNYVPNYLLSNVTNPVDSINIPAAAQAVDCNMTTITPNYSVGAGFLTTYPGPSDPNGNNRPLAVTMLYTNSQYLSNGNIQTLGSDGTINLFNLTYGS